MKKLLLVLLFIPTYIFSQEYIMLDSLKQDPVKDYDTSSRGFVQKVESF